MPRHKYFGAEIHDLLLPLVNSNSAIGHHQIPLGVLEVGGGHLCHQFAETDPRLRSGLVPRLARSPLRASDPGWPEISGVDRSDAAPALVDSFCVDALAAPGDL